MSLNSTDAEDQQLYNNLQQLNSELCSLVDDKDSHCVRDSRSTSGACSVLQELNHRVRDLSLDPKAPQFEFHGFGCVQALGMPKRLLCLDGSAKKKPKPEACENGQLNLVSRQKQKQLQKENVWNRDERGDVTMELIRSIGLFGDCIERNVVLRLMELFKSLHEHITSELPSNQLNSVPSDYVFDLPRKCSMPKGYNVRHHVQVLCTKLERFILRQRRILETNRHFDYTKYTECDGLLNQTSNGLRDLKQFTNIELRQRAMQFVNQIAIDNASRLEVLLIDLRDRIKAAYVCVHVFNWEMDLEHRYSAAMTARLANTNKRALALAAAEFQAAQPRGLCFEEQLIAERYQLGDVVSCAKENEEFLTALLKTPESYFPPEIIALCEPPKHVKQMPPPASSVDDAIDSFDHLIFGGDIVEMGPSSPPRLHHRSHIPRCNRA